eukprot:INCI3711.1.p2 GENE.INCI3711.1~~INCI3711.1.p2  ORF type:complete len:208 (-),score=55.88 INCI3711.1:278-901(-)
MDLLGMIIDSRLEQSNNFRDTFLQQHDDFVNTQTAAAKEMEKHAKIFEDLARDEELPEAQLALASYAVSIKNLSEVYENILKRREEQQIRERFALLRSTYYKPTKVLRQKRSDVLMALEKSNQAINKLRQEGAGGKRFQSAVIDRTANEEQLANVTTQTQKELELFEINRLQTVKEEMTNMIRCQLYFHAKSVECLSTCLASFQVGF